MKNILFLFFFLLTSFWVVTGTVLAQGKVFTASELAAFDGKDGHPAYYAYEGKVYDVTGSKLWENGQHYGLQAGQDLTGKMGDAPHGAEVFAGFAIVGSYGDSGTPITDATDEKTSPDSESRQWFESPLRPLRLSILEWMGVVLAILYILKLERILQYAALATLLLGVLQFFGLYL